MINDPKEPVPPADAVPKRNVLKQALKAINVEPAFFFFCIQLGVIQTMMQAFLNFRICVQEYHARIFPETTGTEEFCANLSHPNNSMVLNAIQSKVATFTTYYSICNSLPAVFSTPIICAWSDSTGGRKKPLILAFATTFLGHIPLILCTSWLDVSYYCILAGVCVMSLGGGAMVVFASGFSSIADQARTKEKIRMSKRRLLAKDMSSDDMGDELLGSDPPDSKTDRIMSVRIGIGSATFSFGMVLGSLLGGYFRTLQEQSVYAWGFLLSASSIISGLLYVIFCMNETHEREDLQGVPRRGEPGHRTGTIMNLLLHVAQTLKAAGRTVIRRREGTRQFRLYLCFFLDFLQTCASMGIGTLLLLYLKRPPLVWSDTQFSYFSAYVNLVSAIGMSIVPTVLTKLPFLANAASKDTILIMIGCFFSATYMLMFAFVEADWHVYTIGILLFFGQLYIPGLRAVFTKVVDKDEAARVMAAVGIVENMTPIIAALIFNNVYSATIHFWDGFCFVMSAFMQYPVIIGISVVHCLMARDIKNRDCHRHEMMLET